MRYLIITLLTAFLISGFTEDEKVTVGTATYTYRLFNDEFEQTATLTFSEEAYKFVYRQIEGGVLELEQGLKYQKIYSDADGHVFFRNHLKDQSYQRTFLRRDAYQLEDQISHQWEIQSDTKSIAGFNCTKAIIDFRGRRYAAWFAPDIPVNAGPWKFYGLPGLIMEVKDDKGLISFQLNDLTFPDKRYTQSPDYQYSGEKISYPDYREKEIAEWHRKVKKSKAIASRMMAEDPELTITISAPAHPTFMETYDFEKKD